MACAAPCAAAPTAVNGWPVRTPAGSVHLGPGGGAVVINQSVIQRFVFTVSAYRLDARRRWVNRRAAGCGNCDPGPQPARRQADDTYGLIGVTGDDFWSVNQAGREVEGCTGAVLPDGTCISETFSFDEDTPPALIAVRGPAELWRLTETGLAWAPESGVAPYVVRDGTNTAYAAYAPRRPTAASWRPTPRPAACGPAWRGVSRWSARPPTPASRCRATRSWPSAPTASGAGQRRASAPRPSSRRT